MNSVIAETDHTGNVLTTRAYTPFGTSSGGTGNDAFSLGFTGRENDNSGLMYYRARYYDPSDGRFISEDPLGFEAGINFYAYVNNNPVNFNDPSGLEGIVGINFGGGGVSNGGRAIRGNVSTIIAIDTQTLDISVVAQREIGGAIATGQSRGLFINAVIGGTNTTLDTLIGDGTAVSGSFALGAFGFNGSLGLPDSDFAPIDLGNGSTRYGFTGPGEFIAEIGVSFLTSTGADLGVTGTTGVEGFRTSLLRDTVNTGIDGINFFGAEPISRIPSSGAAGGFVLYPNRINTNFTQRVYSK